MDCQVCQQLLKAELEGTDFSKINCTIQDISEFESNRVWRDINETLISWLVERRDELEEMGKGFEREDIAYAQAESHMIRCLLNLPAALKSKLEELRDGRDKDGQDSAE